MFYLVFGNEFDLVKTKVDSLVKGAKSKQKNATLYRIDDLNFRPEEFENFLVGTHLFGESKKYIVIVKGLLEKADSREFVLGNLASLKDSQNLFIFQERELSADIIKALKTDAETFFDLTESRPKEKEFDLFKLTDAFGARNRKEAWLQFMQALRAGVTGEQVLWKLLWQLKNLTIVRTAQNETEAGMHQFVFKKSKMMTGNFQKEDLVNLSGKLIQVLSDARSGKREVEFGIELLLLSL